MEQKDKEFWRGMYMLASLGINIVVATFIGLGMGWLIDNKLFPYFGMHTEPWFTMIFLLFGIIAGFRNVISMTRSKMRGEPDEEDKPGDFRDKDNKNGD
jgi:ATP synthase protein I